MIPIKGYEGIYSVTSDGRVYAHPKTGSGGHDGLFLKPHLMRQKKRNNTGYYQVSLCKKNTKKKFCIHTLVLNAYAKKIRGKKICNHIDGNKVNNDISNLEWVDFSGNIKHAYSNGLRKVSDFNIERIRKMGKDRKGKPCFNRRKIKSDQVNIIRQLYKNKKYNTYQLAAMYNVSRTTISRIIYFKNMGDVNAS